MAIPIRIIKLLDASKVKYEAIQHKTVFTAYDKAATLKVPERIIGKTLVLGLDKQLALVLIPANRNLDKSKLKKLAKSKKIDFISERVIKNKFKGVKLGAIPPFGSLFKMATFIDNSLLKESKVYINSGDYNWSIKTSGAGLKKLIADLAAGSFGKAK